MISLGNVVRDTVTGFQGTVTAKGEYLNGCIQFCVLPPMAADGKMPEGQWIDWQRLEVVADGIQVKSSTTGGPQRDQMPSRFRS